MGVGIGSWTKAYLLAVVYLSILHLLIDSAKVRVDKAFPGGYWPLATFLSDQALHVLSVLIVSSFLGLYRASDLVNLSGFVWSDVRYVYLAITYVAVLFGGSVLVRIVTQIFQVPVREGTEQGVEGAGAYIGVIERVAITTLVALGQYGAVGFVLAAKSIARYKKIEEQRGFGEYYLIGTLTSATIAVLAGLVVGRLF